MDEPFSLGSMTRLSPIGARRRDIVALGTVAVITAWAGDGGAAYSGTITRAVCGAGTDLVPGWFQVSSADDFCTLRKQGSVVSNDPDALAAYFIPVDRRSSSTSISCTVRAQGDSSLADQPTCATLILYNRFGQAQTSQPRVCTTGFGVENLVLSPASLLPSQGHVSILVEMPSVDATVRSVRCSYQANGT